jgi:diaminohydroxyphosphoribosylaminopyrimidine deaminase / 5-amino-6-(5-phosphoribosylamino)uracil reductase
VKPERSGRGEARFLRLVLGLAARGAGRTFPNPMVGAVVVRDGRVVGRGFHTRAGAPHAEAVALAQAGRRARGATLYVNLEPCCHFGRTPPCVDAIIGAGVRRVVACMRDPDPRVRGRGFLALRSAGVRVISGALGRQARRLNEEFVRRMRNGRPVVTLKAGMTLDGRIATRAGESKWITSPRSRAEGRELRLEHDAVIVGVNTVLRDDPELRVRSGRGPAGRTSGWAGPVRVVLDARLRTSPRARLFSNGGPPVILAALRGVPKTRRRRLEERGAVVIEAAGRNGRVAVGPVLRELSRRGITSVLVEGGSEVLGAFLDARLADRLVLFVAGRLFGGREALPVFGGLGAARLQEAALIDGIVVRRVGPDLRIEGKLRFPRSRGR